MDSGPETILLEFFFLLLLILINAFFAASEIAIISVNKNKISCLANEGNKKAKLLLKFVEEPSKFLATIQVGITLAGFLASASAAVSISHQFAEVLKSTGIPYASQISLVVVTILLSFFELVLGELLPKRLALQNTEKIALGVVKPLKFISKITLPFVKILTGTTNLFMKIFSSGSEITQDKVTEEEIRMMIDEGEEDGVLNETEKEMIDGIFEFDNTLANEVMTPRTNVFAIDIETPTKQIIDEVLQEQYSRIPVYEDEMDNIIGILYMKDLFSVIRNKGEEDISIKDLLRPAYFVPETKNIDVLFRELQSSKNHMAVLIDEYGGFSGIVTIEDLIEEVMGNIFDEYDEDYESNEFIQKLDNDTYLVNGLVSIDDINETLNADLPTEHCETIGGFVVDLLGNIPNEDDENVVEYENLIFKIQKVNEKRIELLKICVQE